MMTQMIQFKLEVHDVAMKVSGSDEYGNEKEIDLPKQI